LKALESHEHDSGIETKGVAKINHHITKRAPAFEPEWLNIQFCSLGRLKI
jgi:hypothetical protein